MTAFKPICLKKIRFQTVYVISVFPDNIGKKSDSGLRLPIAASDYRFPLAVTDFLFRLPLAISGYRWQLPVTDSRYR
ncbi:hypothetical protein Barb4_00743 [Bacteroidales bacterium Barb4]|nr:hypothetical protein Barb4_00743 [Bacteroidales bacterium Barb4]